MVTHGVPDAADLAADYVHDATFAARLLPDALFGPVAGVFVDRWDRRRSIVVVNPLMALTRLPLLDRLRFFKRTERLPRGVIPGTGLLLRSERDGILDG